MLLNAGGPSLSPRNGSEMELPLRSHVAGEVPRILIDLESGYVLVSIDPSMPLSEGSTLKNVVILSVGSVLMRG